MLLKLEKAAKLVLRIVCEGTSGAPTIFSHERSVTLKVMQNMFSEFITASPFEQNEQIGRILHVKIFFIFIF